MGEVTVNFDLKKLGGTIPKNVQVALASCGQYAQRESKRNAPRSPTMKQGSATLKRKRRSAQRRSPGGLERSIQYAAQGDDVAVFVAQNAECRSAKGYNYAKRIHNEKGTKWFKRGAGTVAKGARADEKFIARAIFENAQKFQSRIDKAVQDALKTI